MRILVAGSVPPPANGHRVGLLDEVVRLRREGHDVEVLALDRLGAAHRYVGVPGLPAALEIGIAGRRFDAVVIQIEPGLPVRAHAGRAERAVALIAFGLLLERVPDVTLRLDRPEDLPGGPGGRAAVRLFSAARRIELGSGVDSEAVAGLLSDGVDRLETVRPGVAATIAVPDVDWSPGDVSASQVNEVVRHRAAATRQAIEGIEEQRSGATAVRVEQWEWLPSPGLGVPDLGRLRKGASGHSANPRSPRDFAARGLAAAERHAASRPAARFARAALSGLRAARAR